MRCRRCRCGDFRQRWATWTKRARSCCPTCPMHRWCPARDRARWRWRPCCRHRANASPGPGTWACRNCSACSRNCSRCAPAWCSPTPARRPNCGTRRWPQCGRKTRPRLRCTTARWTLRNAASSNRACVTAHCAAWWPPPAWTWAWISRRWTRCCRSAAPRASRGWCNVPDAPGIDRANRVISSACLRMRWSWSSTRPRDARWPMG